MKDYYIRISEDGLENKRYVNLCRTPADDSDLNIDDYKVLLQLLEYGTDFAHEKIAKLKVKELEARKKIKNEINEMIKEDAIE